jgi:hypothetical protein
MINAIGVIGGIALLVKIFLHIYLKSQTDSPIPVTSLGRFSPPELFLHYYDDAPKGYKWLKTTINVMYAIAVLCIIVFLIGVNVE